MVKPSLAVGGRVMPAADWEMLMPTTAAGRHAPEDLIAALGRWDLDVGPGADPALLNVCSTCLIEDVFLCDEDAPRRALIGRCRVDPCFSHRLVRDILPAVARRFEEGWAQDRLSFVDVTIGAARMQESLHLLGRIVLPREAVDGVAVVVPPWEQHTLAAAFAVEGLRRNGVMVRLITGRTVAQISALLLRAPVSAAFVSVGSATARERAPDLLKPLRDNRNRAVTLVVGGPGIISDRRVTGADFVALDLSAALDFCCIPQGIGAGMADALQG
jgi:hypothetical protein